MLNISIQAANHSVGISKRRRIAIAIMEYFFAIALIFGIWICVSNGVYAAELPRANPLDHASLGPDEFSVAMMSISDVSPKKISSPSTASDQSINHAPVLQNTSTESGIVSASAK